jgi:predicted nuclease of predicted toxin-antitoxin system
VKLLFDENLSRRLVSDLSSSFPESSHISLVGLGGRTDGEIWTFARENGFTLVSKDTDFRDRSVVSGAPPKVWLSIGNCSTDEILAVIKRNTAKIQRFVLDPQATMLILTAVG